jgi:tubulin alpha
MITGKQDASNCYAEGYFGLGWQFIEPVMELVRREAEKCDALNNFLVFRSLSGGTGSGFGTLLMQRLAEEFGKKGRVELCTYSGPQYTVPVVEAYNAVLATGSSLEYSDCTFMIDNKSVSDICRRNLGTDNGYEHINQLIAKSKSSYTQRPTCHALFCAENLISCLIYDRFATFSVTALMLLAGPVLH